MRYALTVAASLVLAAVAGGVARAAEEKLIHDFESMEELRQWEFKSGKAEISAEHVTRGANCLKLLPSEYMVNTLTKYDWSGYDAMEIDFFVDGAEGVAVSFLVGDQDWSKNPTYWNRHNGGFNLRAGKSTASLPIDGLFRGEAGSRNNDIKHNIRPDKIVRVDFGFKPMGNSVKAIYMDNMRLVKHSIPAGLMAFDFGPESQTIFPGFTGVSWNSIYGQNGRKAGLRRACYDQNRARDDTFPTRLYQDFVEMANDESEFVVDLPNGDYGLWMMYDDCGYWGGENCKHSRRSVLAEGAEVYVDDRGEAGPSDYLFRFERIEPHPGDNLWDLYVGTIFKPVRFDVKVADGQLNLTFKSDAPWSSKVAAMVIYPKAMKDEAGKWLAGIEAANRGEFEDRAQFVGPKPKELAPPAGAAEGGLWLGFPSMEDDVSLLDPPGAADGALSRVGARGTRLGFTFAVRPVGKAGGEVSLTCGGLKGPRGDIPSSNVELRYVHHATRRSFNSIAYTIGPANVRPVAGSGLKLDDGLTRQFWVVVEIPADAGPGKYSGAVRLAAGNLSRSIPVEVEVLDVALDEPDFIFGFYGTHVPGELPQARRAAALRQLLTTLRSSGMNSFTGGPDIPFKGLDATGKPVLDFAACDEFFKIAKECGFTREIQSYGGPAMVTGLHDGYVIGATGHDWEKKTGKSFKELLTLVWTAVREHSEAQGWPKIGYGFTDEPRVLDQANAQLELMRAYREAAPWVRIGGSYSVHWGEDELSRAIQDIFKTLVWSSLNGHGQNDLDKAKELGRELYIYNQGVSRYSFGAYQFAEMRKGIRGRMQWHLLALHGYQYFDLDGREPDSAMLNWGREQVYPTINLLRCAEGASDFRFAVTLWNRAQEKKDSPAGREAIQWLDDVSAKIGVGARQRPAGFMSDEEFRLKCVELLRKLK